MNIGNVYVDPVSRGAMMNVYLVVIGDDLTALFGIAGDVGYSNGPPARRGYNEPTPRRAAQFSNEVLPMYLKPYCSQIFFVFCLGSVDPFEHRFWHRCLWEALDNVWS